MLNQRKRTEGASELEMALCQPRQSHFFFLLTPCWLLLLFNLVVNVVHFIHSCWLDTTETGPDKHTQALTSLTQKKADRSCFTEKCSPSCHRVNAEFWMLFPVRAVASQLKTSTRATSDEQQMWTGTPFLMSSHVHPKNMQLSSPLSVPHYHNCICGSSHCNKLAHVQKWLTCKQVQTKTIVQRMELQQHSDSECLLEVLITS